MGVYRSDQAQLTFAAEAAQGGDPEMIEGTLVGSGGTATVNHAAGLQAGSRKVTITRASGTFTIGDFIRIGTVDGTPADTVIEHEVRRIEAMSDSDGAASANTFTLDRPTAFFHADNEAVLEVNAIGGDATRNDNNKFLTFIPGIYETIETADPTMSIEGRRFLSTTSKRNVTTFYPGQHTLTGGVSGIVLLNGWPLRFPIGSITTTPSGVASDTILLNQAAGAKKGDVYITCDGANVSNLAAGDYIQIVEADGTKSEVRRIITDVSDTFKLNYPLQFDHADNAVINEVSAGAYYTHVINEEVDLDTVTWHVHMKDSTETTGTTLTTKNFDRRYVGGMIGSSTIAAEEGGMLTMSWDSVNFLNMVHNQANQTTVGAASGDLYYGASIEANMPRYGLMQQIDVDDVGMPSHNAASANNGTGYPTTSPYYFSEGTIKFFGVEFARIRSFSLSIANGEEPRYYLGKQGARARGPFEIKEGAREYSMSATVVLPDANKQAGAIVSSANGLDSDSSTPDDSLTSANSGQDSATELFKQLLLEGDYGAGGGTVHRRGFTATLKFERGTNDSITIDIPTSTTAGAPAEGTDNTNQLNKQGIFINSAPHSVTTDNPFQVDLDMIFRSLKITIVDSVPVYP